MLELLVFLLACHGLVSAVTGGRLFAGLRARCQRLHPWLGELARCPMCLGFWVGVGAAEAGVWGGGRGVVQVVVAGLVSSAGCWAGRVVLVRLGEDEL